jgi:hypothetical protein
MSKKQLGLLVALSILLNPIVLLILVVAGIVLLFTSLAFIVYHGIFTAIVLMLVSGVFVLGLHFVKAVDLNKQPLIVAMVPGMFALGFVTERLNIFNAQPLQTMVPSTMLSGNTPILFVLLFSLLGLFVAISRKKKR